jgi:3-phenylpropionate/trans-cinnamate dioxygenase ferredoxin subunit
MVLNYNEYDSDDLEFVPVGDPADLPNGERLFVQIDEHQIVIFNIAGKLYAIADVCSHDNGPLGDGELETDYEVACPRHGAHFDVRNGYAMTLPAIEDIPAYPVRITDGQIEVGIPLE